MSAPSQHLTEALKLEADAIVDLFEIQLKTKPVVLRVKNNNTVSWQGQTYEGMPLTLTGDKRTSDGEEARPTFMFANPLGAFNTYAAQGDFDRAIFIRKRVLRTEMEANINRFQPAMWYVARVREIKSGVGITLELRSMHEGQTFKIPARMYMPPEFPTVSLGAS